MGLVGGIVLVDWLWVGAGSYYYVLQIVHFGVVCRQRAKAGDMGFRVRLLKRLRLQRDRALVLARQYSQYNTIQSMGLKPTPGTSPATLTESWGILATEEKGTEI